ncbi:MAG: hypothetical protein R2939_15845 [Kofleriaceae bacterium]
MVGALVVFCLTYLLLSSRRLEPHGLDRPTAALVGAVAMVIVGGLPLPRALAAVDLHVLALLLGSCSSPPTCRRRGSSGGARSWS